MKVGELRKSLRELATARGDTDLERLADSMAPLDALEVEDLSKVIASAIAKATRAEALKAKRVEAAAEKARQAEASVEAAVSRYVTELKQTASDNTAFEDTVKRIERDKAVKAPHAEQIAQRFMSTAATFKTKKSAMKAVLNRQIADKRAAERSSQVSEIF